ncbi:glutathione S-transferase family protein [Archangium sp.]|uniref:glutathione S-transferase family protein n=1 Tax=Archangium sp. TaxID=1872627 RepID=UPI002D3F7F3C|nr:glutathione S-transferase family protein [Archangium sp.]HYO53604.1 glutathione S-transferase family protein [Archangium sp.]
MKLYFTPETRSLRPRWLLEELGVPYELSKLDLSKDEQKQPWYMKVHPLGVVPALEIDGFTVIETAAIVMHLADKYPEKGLAPAVGTKERAEYYQWISLAMTEAEPPLINILLNTQILPEAERQPAAVKQGTERFKFVASVVEKHMQGRNYIVGDKFTAADVVMGGVLRLGGRLGQLGPFPVLQAYLKRLVERPAAVRAINNQ